MSMRTLLLTAALVLTTSCATTSKLPGITQEMDVNFAQTVPPEPDQVFVCSWIGEAPFNGAFVCADVRLVEAAKAQLEGAAPEYNDERIDL
jgi:hypothetical protein